MLFNDGSFMLGKSSGNCKDFKFWCGEEQERSWRTDIEQIFRPNLTEEFSGCTSGNIEENLVDVGKSRHTKKGWDQNCVGTTGLFWPNVPTFGCRGDMSPSCWQLSQPRCWPAWWQRRQLGRSATLAEAADNNNNTATSMTTAVFASETMATEGERGRRRMGTW